MKTVLITGASSGIGKETARLFIKNGYSVFAAARRIDRMNDLKKEGADIIALDVTDDASCEDAFGLIEKKAGGVDILVNCAGYGEYGPVEAVGLDSAQKQIEVNLFGAVRAVKLTIPYMREKGRGRIINISSAAGRVTTYMGGWYHATKYALEAISDSLRMELGGFGIDVVLIEPGGVRSAWGSITADNLSLSAKGTVYAGEAAAIADIYRVMYGEDNPRLTSPKKAARVIYKAATVKKPRTRYLFGYGAKALVFAKAVLPTRAFDAVMKRMYTSKAAKAVIGKARKAGE